MPSDDTTTDVTLLGLGAMGRALARALADNGTTVTVWNRTCGRAGDLPVAEAQDVAAAVAASPVTLVCVLDYAIARDVLSPADLTGRTVANLGNGTPRQAREFGTWIRERGARYVDGAIMAVPPLIGTEKATVLVSGDERAMAEQRATLQRLGRVEFLGTDDGMAAAWDLALLSGMYGLLGGFAHAAILLTAEGASATDLLPRFGAWIKAMTPSLSTMANQIDARNFDTDVTSPLAMQAHAMRYLVEAAQDQGMRPDLLAGLAGLTRDAVDAGHGEHDFAAITEVLRRG